MSWEKTGDKRNALKKVFFSKQNRELIKKIKTQSTQAEICSELAKVSNISDQKILDKLYEAGIVRRQ